MRTACRQHRALSSELRAGKGHQLVCGHPVQVQSPGAIEVRAPESGHFPELLRCVASLKNGGVKSMARMPLRRRAAQPWTRPWLEVSIGSGMQCESQSACVRAPIWPNLLTIRRCCCFETSVLNRGRCRVRQPWQTPPSKGCRQTASGNPEQCRYLSRWSRWSRSSKTVRATRPMPLTW